MIVDKLGKLLIIRIKRSDRRPFILVLDWILVHATSIIGINLSQDHTYKGQNKITKNKLVTRQTYEGHEIYIYFVNVLLKFKDITARLLF